MHMIPTNYYDGIDTLKYATPWITPESICWLENNLNRSMHAVEFGCGGSTVFLAERCATVFSMDNNQKWVADVDVELHRRGIHNATVEYKPDYQAMINSFNRSYDVAFIDCCDVSRHDLCKYMSTRAEIIVVDNYAADYVGDTNQYFDEHWRIWEFRDLHWQGNGTKIYRRVS